VETHTGGCKEGKPSSTYIGFCGYISSLSYGTYRKSVSVFPEMINVIQATTNFAVKIS
jgi:hypothetical protein